MQKNTIIEKLREQGFRITKQRRMLLDIILEEKCACCKEICYKAQKQDKTIGTATVYRMVNALEDIGAISRTATYEISYDPPCSVLCPQRQECRVELEDGTIFQLSGTQWEKIVTSGLQNCGYLSDDQEIKQVIFQPDSTQ